YRDLLRFPFRFKKSHMITIIISIMVSLFIYMVLVIAVGERDSLNNVLMFISIMSLTISIQLTIAIPFSTVNSNSSTYFFAFYGAIIQLLLILLTSFDIDYLILLPAFIIIMITAISIGGNYENSKGF